MHCFKRTTESLHAPHSPLPAPRSRLSQMRNVNAPPRPNPPHRGSAAPQARPHPDASAASKATGPATRRSGLSDDRLKELHGRLLEAKRQTGETGSVSAAGLARSLRAAEAKLLQKHGPARNVDFDIVIRDGKAVVKPIVR